MKNTLSFFLLLLTIGIDPVAETRVWLFGWIIEILGNDRIEGINES